MPIFLDSNTNDTPYLNLNPIEEENIPKVLASPVSKYYKLTGIHVPYPSSIEISSQHRFTDDKSDIMGMLGISEGDGAKLNLERFGTHGYLNLSQDMRNETLGVGDIRGYLEEAASVYERDSNKISVEDQKLIAMGDEFDKTFPYLRPDNLSLLYQRSPKRMLKTNITLKCINKDQLDAAKNIVAFLNTKQLPRASKKGTVGGISTIILQPPPMWAIWASDSPRTIHNPRYFPDFHHCYLVAMAIKTSGGNSDMVNYVFEAGSDEVGGSSSPISITLQLAFMEVETTMARVSSDPSAAKSYQLTANYSNFSSNTPD